MTAALVVIVGQALVPAGPLASATVPGMPGVTQPGTPVYTEDFSNQSATTAAIDIRNYTGGAAAANSTYTADTQWTPAGNQCNGWILSTLTPSLPTTDSGCQRNLSTTRGQINSMVEALGLAQGQTATAALANQVLTAYTNASNGTVAAGTQFRTVNTIPAIAGHYYAVSAYFAAVNCPAQGGASQPSETFSLIVNGTPIVLSTGLNPCTQPDVWEAQVAKLQSAAYMVPVGTTANLGLSLYNAQTSGSGNDVAFDLPQIVDVTPQLDKSFNPTLIHNGGVSKVTLTVTNTSDLMAKSDWFLTDVLPTNVSIAATPNVGGTCIQRTGAAYTVTAPAGGSTVTVTGGDLALNQASCTITFDVTSSVNGTYINGPANITTNLNPPADATLQVISDPAAVANCDNVWYVTNNPANPSAPGNVGYVNPATGVWKTVDTLSDQSSGLAINPNTNVAYYGGYVPGTTSPDGIAYRLDLSTGVSTRLNTTAHPMFVSNRLAVSPDGTLWSMTVDGHLWSTTPTATTIGTPVDHGLVVGTGIATGDADIAFDGVGNLYILSSGATSQLWVISAETMAAGGTQATLVGGVGSQSFSGLAIGANGNFYASSGTTLYQINPATGAVTSAATGGPTRVGDLATCATPEPSLSATKDVSPSGTVYPGAVLTYTIEVTNSGPIAASGSTLIDAIPTNTTYVAGSTALNGSSVADVSGFFPYATAREVHSPGAFTGVIAAGATATVTFQVTVNTPFPTNVTEVANQGFVDGNGVPQTPTDWPVTPTPDDPVITPVIDPALLLEKSAAVTDVDEDGVTGLDDEILFTFVVTNTGTATVSALAISDPLLAGLGITITCTPTAIAPTEQATCVADDPYIVTQADVTAMKVENVATANGTDPLGNPVESNPDSTETPIALFRIPLQILKVGENVDGVVAPMAGSTFAILEDVAGEPGLPIALTINPISTGLIEIEAIESGTYWLTELVAPEGFSLLANPVQFTINPDRTVSITGNGGGAVTADGQLITVHDVPALVMPGTGGSGTTPYLIVGLLLLLAAGGLSLAQRHRSPRYSPPGGP